jgi:hypothetical protein
LLDSICELLNVDLLQNVDVKALNILVFYGTWPKLYIFNAKWRLEKLKEYRNAMYKTNAQGNKLLHIDQQMKQDVRIMT